MRCTHYQTRANFFVGTVSTKPRERFLVIRYEDEAEFYIGIPNDWCEEKVLLLIRTPWRGAYPIWEMPARVFGSTILVGEPSFVEDRLRGIFPR
jgi:hypothetical protein